MKNENCVCQNVTCKNHGNCTACRANHANNENFPLTSCQRLEKEKELGEKK